MTAHASKFLVPLAAIVAALSLSPGIAGAAQSNPSPGAVNDGDRQADMDARHDLGAALSRLAKGNRVVARDRLERAETALLNKESLDLGAGLNPDHPLPQSQETAKIDQARAALADHKLSQASQLATTAEQDLRNELGPAS